VWLLQLLGSGTPSDLKWFRSDPCGLLEEFLRCCWLVQCEPRNYVAIDCFWWISHPEYACPVLRWHLACKQRVHLAGGNEAVCNLPLSRPGHFHFYIVCTHAMQCWVPLAVFNLLGNCCDKSLPVVAGTGPNATAASAHLLV
jgi:hypothetical protein